MRRRNGIVYKLMRKARLCTVYLRFEMQILLVVRLVLLWLGGLSAAALGITKTDASAHFGTRVGWGKFEQDPNIYYNETQY